MQTAEHPAKVIYGRDLEYYWEVLQRGGEIPRFAEAVLALTFAAQSQYGLPSMKDVWQRYNLKLTLIPRTQESDEENTDNDDLGRFWDFDPGTDELQEQEELVDQAQAEETLWMSEDDQLLLRGRRKRTRDAQGRTIPEKLLEIQGQAAEVEQKRQENREKQKEQKNPSN
jgi:hypothetical protein